MRKGDPQGPTRTGLPNTMGPCQPLEGRWCGECGGELLYRRRREAGLIVSYLVCQFCAAKTPMLSCDVATMRHADLSPEPAAVTLSRRECHFCRRLRLPAELTIGALRGQVGFALGCKGGCAPKGAMRG